MNMRRLLPALLLALALAACQGGSEQPSPSASLPSSPSTANSQPTSPSEALSVPELVARLRPSVVHILTESASISVFGQPVPQQGVGTGIVISPDGYIVTNNHVVVRPNTCDTPAQSITVTLADGRRFRATVVGRDPLTDLAVLRIDASGLQAAALGDSEALQVGEEVVAMGNALNLPGGPTVTKGVVSAKDRTIQEDQCGVTIPGAIQTDAAINPGNSGGPLVNMRGEVVGITTAVIRGGEAEGVGFAISTATARPIIQALMQQGRVERAYLGVALVDVTPQLARQFDLPVEQGVVVTQVVPGSPAARAGLRPNDIIVRLGGRDIRNSGELLQALTQLRAGQTVQVEFYRNGNRQTADITLGQRPS
jgi:S1-C subfamily serine protease